MEGAPVVELALNQICCIFSCFRNNLWPKGGREEEPTSQCTRDCEVLGRVVLRETEISWVVIKSTAPLQICYGVFHYAELKLTMIMSWNVTLSPQEQMATHHFVARSKVINYSAGCWRGYKLTHSPHLLWTKAQGDVGAGKEFGFFNSRLIPFPPLLLAAA